MTELMNKLLVLICCLIVYVLEGGDLYMVVPVIVVLILSALGSLWDRPAVRVTALFVLAGLAVFFAQFLVFAPLLLYDIFRRPYAFAGLAVILPAAVHLSDAGLPFLLVLLLLTGLAYWLKLYAVRLDALKNSYIQMRDETKEFEFALAQKNKELMEKQDYEVKLATLNERNRIAREIHDSVGHVMSSSILQVGALIATVQDQNARQGLLTLKNTLTEGMNSIRSSVHDLHEEAVDLDAQLYALVREFTFCPLAYDYDVQNSPGLKEVYSVIAIVKEALANIIRHSEATSASLVFRELPGFYQLIVSDNGSPQAEGGHSGMGIRNMKARIDSLNGHLHLSTDRGFRIFISIPKEVKPG